MDTAPVSALTSALDKVFENVICSQLWSGYGDALFIGFGSEVLLSPAPGQSHLLPKYELQTWYSDWFVESTKSASAEDMNKHYQPIDASAILLGRRVTGWELDSSSFNIKIYFDNNVVLHVVSWKPAELSDEEHDTDAWSIRLPDGSYLSVSCAGVITFDTGRDA